MNSVSVIGNIANDPTQKVFGESKVVNFRVAVDQAGGKKDDGSFAPGFFDVSCWNGQGQAVMDYCRKGSKIGVHGSLRQRTWETDSGEKRYAVEIGNARVTFCEKASSTPATPAAAPEAETKPAPSDDDIPF